MLFDGALPPCLITLQRGRRAYGYFWGGHFINSKDQSVTDEIALNPSEMANRTVEDILSTLVHEMCHLWQFHFSRYPSRRGKVRPYHDKEWGGAMEDVGFVPSSTGEPGGWKTGPRVSHYVAKNGPFQKACNNLLATGFTLTWLEWEIARKKSDKGDSPVRKDTSKTAYRCPECKLNAWAKPFFKPICGECQRLLEATPRTGEV